MDIPTQALSSRSKCAGRPLEAGRQRPRAARFPADEPLFLRHTEAVGSLCERLDADEDGAPVGVDGVGVEAGPLVGERRSRERAPRPAGAVLVPAGLVVRRSRREEQVEGAVHGTGREKLVVADGDVHGVLGTSPPPSTPRS